MKALKPSLNWLPWGLLIALYFALFEMLYRARWEMLDYGHAFFILPVSLILVWTLRSRLREAISISEASKSGITQLIVLVAGLALFFVGWQFQYAFIQALSLIPVLFGLTGYLYGSRVARLLAFPILYLSFLVPPPLGVLDSITFPMRYGVSVATQSFLAALNFPITRDGLLLFIGGHEVYLGEACSGFRSLVAFGSLGSAYIYTMKIDTSKKWILGFSIIPFALLGNLIRVASVCLVTYYLGESKAQQYYHDLSGFVVFLVLIAGLLQMEKILSRGQKK